MIPPELLERQRTTQSQIVTLANRDLVSVWRTVDLSDAANATAALLPVVRDVTSAYGETAAVLAADFYDDARSLSGVPGRFRATAAGAPPVAQSDAMTRWALTPLWSRDPRSAAALARLAGGTGRLIRASGQETISESAVRDPQATGWQRITGSDACSFCRMLADRGAVYSDATVRFASHDNCNCSAAPSWERGPRLSVEQYAASKRRQTPADRARVRAYLAENYS